MEQIKELTREGLQPQLSQWQMQPQSATESSTQGISLLEGPTMDAAEVAAMSTDLQIAFPAVKPEFWAMLFRTMREDGWSGKRARYAVRYIIRNYRYGDERLRIADFMACDLRIEIVPSEIAQSETDPLRYIRTTKGYIKAEDFIKHADILDVVPAQAWKIEQIITKKKELI